MTDTGRLTDSETDRITDRPTDRRTVTEVDGKKNIERPVKVTLY